MQPSKERSDDDITVLADTFVMQHSFIPQMEEKSVIIDETIHDMPSAESTVLCLNETQTIFKITNQNSARPIAVAIQQNNSAKHESVFKKPELVKVGYNFEYYCELGITYLYLLAGSRSNKRYYKLYSLLNSLL